MGITDNVLNWILYQFRQFQQVLFPEADLIIWKRSSFGYCNQKYLCLQSDPIYQMCDLNLKLKNTKPVLQAQKYRPAAVFLFRSKLVSIRPTFCIERFLQSNRQRRNGKCREGRPDLVPLPINRRRLETSYFCRSTLLRWTIVDGPV